MASSSFPAAPYNQSALLPSGLAWRGSNNTNTVQNILSQVIIQTRSLGGLFNIWKQLSSYPEMSFLQMKYTHFWIPNLLIPYKKVSSIWIWSPQVEHYPNAEPNNHHQVLMKILTWLAYVVVSRLHRNIRECLYLLGTKNFVRQLENNKTCDKSPLNV